MKCCIHTLLINLLEFSFPTFCLLLTIVLIADHVCYKAFVRIRRISIIKRNTHKSIQSFSKEIKTITPYTGRDYPNALRHLAFLTLTLLKTTGHLSCRLYLTVGLLTLPHDSIQVLPLWQEQHRSSVFSVSSGTRFPICPVAEDVPSDHLTKVVSAGLLPHKVTAHFFVINEYQLNPVNILSMIKLPRYFSFFVSEQVHHFLFYTAGYNPLLSYILRFTCQWWEPFVVFMTYHHLSLSTPLLSTTPTCSGLILYFPPQSRNQTLLPGFWFLLAE